MSEPEAQVAPNPAPEVEFTPESLDAMEARAAAATKGPWEVVPRTDDSVIEADDECHYCGEGRTLVSAEEYEGDETTASYTLHRHEAAPHHVVAGGTEITGQVDYEEGGIIRAEDTAFIAAARTEHPALIGEVRRQAEELSEFEELCNRQAAILTQAANAFKGAPGPLAMHSHHDVGELAEIMMAEVRGLRVQARALQDDAWKRGYDACKTGDQRHSPYTSGTKS